MISAKNRLKQQRQLWYSSGVRKLTNTIAHISAKGCAKQITRDKHCYPLEYEGENQAFSSQKHASFKGSQQMLYYITPDHDQCNCANERHSSTAQSGHKWLTFEIAKLEHVSPSLTGSCRETIKEQQ